MDRALEVQLGVVAGRADPPHLGRRHDHEAVARPHREALDATRSVGAARAANVIEQRGEPGRPLARLAAR